MGPCRTHLARGLWAALLLAGLALALVPQGWLPDPPPDVAAARGEFDGTPVRLAAPAHETRPLTVHVEVAMRAGACTVGLRDAGGVHAWGTARVATWGASIAPGDEVLLDPQGHPGRYEVAIRVPGEQWRLLGPRVRRFVLLPGVAAALLATLFRRRLRDQAGCWRARGFGTARQALVGALVVLSGLVLYPVVHEAGHLLVGAALGGTVDLARVTWTPLGGEEPRAAFHHLPDAAGPWMSAGGTLLPTVVALLLLALRRALAGRAPWSVSAALFVVAVVFLFATLGALLELGTATHLDALAVHLDLTGAARALFSLAPLLVAAVVLALLLRPSRRW